MLRGSSEISAETANLRVIVDGAAALADTTPADNAAGAAVLLDLADAALFTPDSLADARQAVVAELGRRALVDAAGVIGNFQKMVRIADSTGIPVDAGMAAAGADIRSDLGLDKFASARLQS